MIIIDRYRDFPACQNGPCEQGRKLCPSPLACHVSEPEPAAAPEPAVEPDRNLRALVFRVGIGMDLALVAAAFGVWWWLA